MRRPQCLLLPPWQKENLKQINPTRTLLLLSLMWFLSRISHVIFLTCNKLLWLYQTPLGQLCPRALGAPWEIILAICYDFSLLINYFGLVISALILPPHHNDRNICTGDKNTHWQQWNGHVVYSIFENDSYKYVFFSQHVKLPYMLFTA